MNPVNKKTATDGVFIDKTTWGFNYSHEIPTNCKLDRKTILFHAITEFLNS